MTGILTYTATCDGTIDYVATREGNPYEAAATVFVTDTGNTCGVPVDEETEETDETDDSDGIELVSADLTSEVRVLPNVGANSDLNALGLLAVSLMVAGAVVVAAARRPRLRD